MNPRLLTLSLAALQLLAGSAFAQSNPLSQILRGLGQAILQNQSGKVQPLRPHQGGYGPRVLNVTDSQGVGGFINQGQVFHIVGEGFGMREGQISLLPEGSDQWVTLRGRAIQSWSDDHITAVIAEPLFNERQMRVAVGVVTAEGHSDAMSGLVFQNSGGGSGRPLPPIPVTRPGYDDRYDRDHDHGRDRDHDRDRFDRDDYVGQAPANVTWSVAAVDGSPDESPRDTFAAGTLSSLGGPVAKGSAGNNTRHWAGATVGLMTIGTPSNPPWHHFVVAIAGGSPNAARLANTVASAGARGLALRPGPGPTPPGGFPMLAVSTERLQSDQQVTDALPESQACEVDARLLREALRLTLPPEVGRLKLGSIDELGRSTCGEAKSVVKCLSGEGRNMTVLVFLARTDEPYRRRDGRTDWRSARSVRVAVLGNGPRTHEDCCRVFDGR